MDLAGVRFGCAARARRFVTSASSDARAKMMVLLAAIAGLIFLANVVRPALTAVTHGYSAYYTAARLILEGRWSERVYDDAWFSAEVLAQTGGRVSDLISYNPPGASLLMLPFAGLGLAGARLGWTLFNLLLLAASLRLIVAALPRPAGLGFRAGFLALVFSFAPLAENFRVGQAYVLLLFLFALVFWGLTRSRPALTGVALAVAALAKLGGGPIWLVLAARGRRRELVSSALASGGLFLLSLIATGWAGWRAFIESLPVHLSYTPWAAHLAFQTTPSFFQHLFVADAEWNPRPLWNQPWLASLLTLGAVTVLVVSLWRCRRADWDLLLGMAITLGVIGFPLAEEYHYALLLLPLAVIASRIAGSPAAREIIWLAAVVILLATPWPYKSPALNDGWAALLAYPRLYGGWLAWGLLLRLASKKTHAPVA